MKGSVIIQYIKSPLNYTGGKYKLLPQILPLFPKNISTFVDLFCGGCNVGINVQANQIICNDIITNAIDLYNTFKNNSKDYSINYINDRISEYKLSKSNQDGYLQLRKEYNKNKNPLDLYVLLTHAYNFNIRFNNSNEFNASFGWHKSGFNDSLKEKINIFINEIHNMNILFTNYSFDSFNYNDLCSNDFVYCDPPYLITCATYCDGKRGFTGWNEQEEIKLYNILDTLNSRNIKFALSNILEHGDKKNIILSQWSKQYNINYLDYTYSNSNASKKDRHGKSIEVLITNY